ncbi:MAG: MFS transporter, partial [Halioglobus sp.]|nr:MFS transporter [Halioglobus sp.]
MDAPQPILFGLDNATREGTRSVGPFTAIWYIVFMLPFFAWVKEPRVTGRKLRIGAALADLWRLLQSLTRRRSLAAYLGSSMFYRDALNGIYGFGGIYASGVLGWTVIQIGIFGVVGAVTAAVASWIGGLADRRYGPKPVIVTCILILIAVCSVLVGMSRDSLFGVRLGSESDLPDHIFYACGALQASSRTMMV